MLPQNPPPHTHAHTCTLVWQEGWGGDGVGGGLLHTQGWTVERSGGCRGRDSEESGLSPCSTQPPAPDRSLAAGSLGVNGCARHLRQLKAWCTCRRWSRLPGEGGWFPEGFWQARLAAEVRSI